jgi:hypothetical protein
MANDPIHTAKGDIVVATGNGSAQVVPVGSNGQILVASSGETAGVKWIDDTFGWDFIIDTASTGVKLFVEIPYKCSITSVRMISDQPGAVVLDLWVDSFANVPPTDADSITSATPPTIAATNQKSEDTALTNWTKDFTAGQIMAINVDSVTTITWVVISIRGKKTAVT